MTQITANALLRAFKETWCASTTDDHFIGDDTPMARQCPVCKYAREIIAQAEKEEKQNGNN